MRGGARAPSHSVHHETIHFTPEMIRGICSMDDFYKATGIAELVKGKTITDVRQVWMNKQACEGLEDIVEGNLKRQKKYRLWSDHALHTAVAMDWLCYSPPESTMYRMASSGSGPWRTRRPPLRNTGIGERRPAEMIKRKIVEEISEYDEKGILVRTTTTTTTEEDDSATSGYAHISIPSDGSWKVGPDDPPWEATTSVSCGGGDTAAQDDEVTEESEAEVTIEVDDGILKDLAREVAAILRGGMD